MCACFCDVPKAQVEILHIYIAGRARACTELCRKGSYLLTMKCTRTLASTQGEGYFHGFSRDPHNFFQKFPACPFEIPTKSVKLPNLPTEPHPNNHTHNLDGSTDSN